MRGDPIKEYRLTLECNGRTKTAVIRHDLYGTDDHILAVKDIQDALTRLMFMFNADESS